MQVWQILTITYLTLDSEDLFCCYARKKWFPWIMAAAQASENHGDEAWSDEEWRRDVYINSNLNILPKSLAAAEALSLKSLETETIWSEFPNGWKAIVEQMLASEEINKIKIAGLWVTIWDPVMKVNYLSEVIWDRKIITELTWSISSTRIG